MATEPMNYISQKFVEVQYYNFYIHLKKQIDTIQSDSKEEQMT